MQTWESEFRSPAPYRRQLWGRCKFIALTLGRQIQVVSQSLLVNQCSQLVIGIKEIKWGPHKLSKWQKETVEHHQSARRCSMELWLLWEAVREWMTETRWKFYTLTTIEISQILINSMLSVLVRISINMKKDHDQCNSFFLHFYY